MSEHECIEFHCWICGMWKAFVLYYIHTSHYWLHTTHLILCVPFFHCLFISFTLQVNFPSIIVGWLSCLHVPIAVHRIGMCVLCIVPHLPLYTFSKRRILCSQFMCKFPCSCKQQFDQKMHISKPIVGFIVCLVCKLTNEYVHSHRVFVWRISYRQSARYGITVNTLNLHYVRPMATNWSLFLFSSVICDLLAAVWVTKISSWHSIKSFICRESYLQIESTEYTNPTKHLWWSGKN